MLSRVDCGETRLREGAVGYASDIQIIDTEVALCDGRSRRQCEVGISLGLVCAGIPLW